MCTALFYTRVVAFLCQQVKSLNTPCITKAVATSGKLRKMPILWRRSGGRNVKSANIRYTISAPPPPLTILVLSHNNQWAPCARKQPMRDIVNVHSRICIFRFPPIVQEVTNHKGGTEYLVLILVYQTWCKPSHRELWLYASPIVYIAPLYSAMGKY